jgi:hypothetical protein
MNRHEIVLNGKKFSAHCGIIGIGPDGYLYEGYDGGFGEGVEVTQEDRIALAKLMIERWQQVLET